MAKPDNIEPDLLAAVTVAGVPGRRTLEEAGYGTFKGYLDRYFPR
jgi:hypothetical protein